MTIRVALNHVTHYRYDDPVQLSPQVVRLRPAAHCRTPVLSYSLKATPAQQFINWQQDPQGNFLARFVFPEPTRELRIEVDLVADMTIVNPFDFFVEPAGEFWPLTYEPALERELKPYLETLPLSPEFEKYLATIPRVKRNSVDFVVDINRDLGKHIGYLIRLEPGVQTPEETLAKRSGSCRDSAWLLVQILRRLGLAARFASGYLIQLTADVKALDGPSGTDKDFTDLHAWTEVYLPGAGWIGFDPTSGLLAGEGHIPLACSPDPQSAAPISGGFAVLGGAEETETSLDFRMTVKRIHEDPRVTKPYTEEQWAGIEALGLKVDADLAANDVRLTMGGEPTFVSIDDMDGAEWTTAALGANKRLLAGELTHRLRARFADGALLHIGQGKWYPGEPLPRWALGLYWRKDGVPIWTRPELFADERKPAGHTDKDSGTFITALSERLGAGAKWLMPAYEDTWYYLWKERKLPSNVDPLANKLDTEQDRQRFAKIFAQSLDKVVGHVLPLGRVRGGGGPGWVSGPWFLRQEHLYLMPGDSPIGLRLPLDSLPWASADDLVGEQPLDPLALRPPLPAREQLRPPQQAREAIRLRQAEARLGGAAATRAAPGAGAAPGDGPPPDWLRAERKPGKGESAAYVVRTALCVEPRGGILNVFMPPVPYLEDYLELVTAIEDTAAATGLPVLIEGYTPPRDSRLRTLAVTPDPGVIEVNIHPAANWRELVDNTTTLYEEARQTRLGTEKFMLDGRHTGTGGGNHVTMGGATPADSPFLRRPDLLRSLLAYWHNHPALSYLFSGLFIGATSQAPRPDEARTEVTYELQLALDQIPDHGKVPPWLVDRILRHVLVDVTGNTHRTQFSIDKLYMPDSATGRLGLLELRAFEMPPHARMSLASQLLLRGLVSQFWRQPYHQKLARWGMQLQDRFMLPHFLEQDFNDVLADLGDGGYGFKPEWFAPHVEFRFPRYGEFAHRGIHFELRGALEPWHVLGEEASAGGTARYVDSSLERMQVKVLGMTGDRHIVACNGVPLPLHPTGTETEFVAGVRFRTNLPPSCLHPTIGAHAPLVFDLVDTWNKQVVAGCTYHVDHPGGRNYPQFPVNANAAEARRHARFSINRHSPGSSGYRHLVTGVPPARSAEFPFTLDLRQTRG